MSASFKAVIKNKLQEAGLRATSQRIAILQVLETADEHLDADTIYAEAKKLDATISLATVYRTLARFKALGLVRQRYLSSSHNREYYERANKGEHYHFHCRSCGKVLEIETKRIKQLREELSAQLGIRFTSACICFEGYCAECAAQQSDQNEHEPAGFCSI
jgi:Fe2+ or Zn2+ uptake regulation protein